MKAITRAVPSSLASCELTFITRSRIDVERARKEHEAYIASLRRHGADVLLLPPDDAHPDSVFVEDPILVLDEVAFALPMGAASRSDEIDALVEVIRPYRTVVRLAGPGSIEGGDVLRVGRDLYVGVSARTDEAGVRQLRDAAVRHGYRVHPVRVSGCLHLKTGCTRVGDHFLVNGEWIDIDDLRGGPVLRVPAGEPFGSNTLSIGETVLTMASCPATGALLERTGLRVEPIEMAELQKAEAGLTCLSVLFASNA